VVFDLHNLWCIIVTTGTQRVVIRVTMFEQEGDTKLCCYISKYDRDKYQEIIRYNYYN